MELSKINIIALCGQAGSGKDTVLKALKEKYPGLHEIVSCTTRPPREGEVDGINYHFLTNEEFAEKVLNNDMLEATVFNDWCYGTALSDLDKETVNIGVFNPEGIAIIKEDPRLSVDTYLIYTNDKERLLRQLNRETNPNVNEIIRRFYTDNADFQNLEEKIGDFVALQNTNKQDIQDIVNFIGHFY